MVGQEAQEEAVKATRASGNNARKRTRRIAAVALGATVLLSACGTVPKLNEQREVEQMASVLEEIGKCEPEATAAAVAMLRMWALRVPVLALRMAMTGAAELLRYHCNARRGKEERRKLREDLDKLEKLLSEFAETREAQGRKIKELQRLLSAQRHRRSCGEYRYITPRGCKDKRYD